MKFKPGDPVIINWYNGTRTGIVVNAPSNIEEPYKVNILKYTAACYFYERELRLPNYLEKIILGIEDL